EPFALAADKPDLRCSFLDTGGRKRVAAPGHAWGERYAQSSDVSLFAAPSGGIELSSVIRLILEERNKGRRAALLRRCSPPHMVRRRNVEKAPPFADDEAKAVAFPFRFDPYYVLAQRERHLVFSCLDARRCERKHRADAKEHGPTFPYLKRSSRTLHSALHRKTTAPQKKPGCG